MAFGTSVPDATDRPAKIHTMAAVISATNLLAACMSPPWSHVQMRVYGVVVNYNTNAITSPIPPMSRQSPTGCREVPLLESEAGRTGGFPARRDDPVPTCQNTSGEPS